MRKLVPFLLLTGLAVPLAGCGDESDPMDGAAPMDPPADAMDAPLEPPMDDAAGGIDHGSKSGDMDHQGEGAGEGGGEKHK